MAQPIRFHHRPVALATAPWRHAAQAQKQRTVTGRIEPLRPVWPASATACRRRNTAGRDIERSVLRDMACAKRPS
jgi:hypothetical protein